MPNDTNNPNPTGHDLPRDDSIPTPTAPTPTVWDLIQMCGPKSTYEGWNARFTVSKLEHIYENFAAGIITKDIAMKMLDALEAGDIAKHCQHEVTKSVFDQAIAAFRAI